MKEHKSFEICFIDTGQHYDRLLSQAFIEELRLPIPDYNLKIGSAHQSIQISRVISRLSPIIKKEKPDLVVVFGDTNSTSGASICAASFGVPIAHIEAGLREWKKKIPEEVNKLITDSIADLYFCPSDKAVENLRLSGINKHVYKVGDVGRDLLNQVKDRLIPMTVLNKKYGINPQAYYFLTLHRSNTTGNKETLQNLLSVINELEIPIIFPIHPGTLKQVKKAGLVHLVQNKYIQLIDPIGFIETQSLIRQAKLVLTDSGGVIKEAYYHQVPCVILDHQTEWVEIVNSGWAKLSYLNKKHIRDIICNFEKPAIYKHYFGNGNACKRIAMLIYAFLQSEE